METSKPLWRLLLMAGAAVSNPVTAGSPAQTISKSEVRSAPPAVTHQRLRDAVWSMFEQQDYRTKKRPTRPLYRLSLRTKTQGTHVPGLCRYDSVEVKFEPTAS